jgi:hypothetical protein
VRITFLLLLVLVLIFLTGCFGPPIVKMGELTVTAVDVATVPVKRKIIKEVTNQGDDTWKTENQKDTMTGCYGKCDKKEKFQTVSIHTQTVTVQNGENTK